MDADNTKACPFCAETIKAEAKKCRYCGEFLEGYTRASVTGGEGVQSYDDGVEEPEFARAARAAALAAKGASRPSTQEGADLTPISRIKLRQFNVALDWDGEASLSGFDLSKCDLAQVTLESADLTGAVLRKAILSQAALGGAALNNADLRGATLLKADLRESALRSANLEGADLVSADLRGADLRFAYLGSAYMFGAELAGAHLRGAVLIGVEDLVERQLVTLENLQGAIMPDGARYDGRYNLEGDLEHARSMSLDMESESAMADFYGTSLDAYFAGQEWAGAKLGALRAV